MKAERRIKECKKKKWNRKETEKEGRAGGREYLPTRTWKSPKCTRRTQRRTQIIGDYRVSEISYFLVLHSLKVLFLLDLYHCKMCRFFFPMIKQKMLHLHKLRHLLPHKGSSFLHGDVTYCKWKLFTVRKKDQDLYC